MPWERELLDDIFTQTDEGIRRYRQAYVGVARKNGKSTLGAALALYGLLMDKEPGAEVYSVAGDRQQARVVFDEARAMVENDPELNKRIRTFRYHLEDPKTHSEYRVLAADAKLQQGLNPSWVIFDEVHVQPNEDLWAAMRDGMVTRRQPFLFGITTAGWDRQTLAWRLYEYGRRVEAGEVDDPTFYFRWWEPKDKEAAPDDEKAWAEANPSLGELLTLDALRSDSRSSSENDFRRFHMNQWTTTASAWLPHGTWDAIKAPERTVDPKERIVIGFDGSWTNDSTAMVGCTVEDPHLFVIEAWEKPPLVDNWVVPSDEVSKRLEQALGEYDVVEVACDPHYWHEQIARWEESGWPIVEWPTNAPTRMVPACRQFFTGVIEQKLTQDGDARLRRHLANAVTKTDAFGTRIVKQASAQKIDLAVAATIAYDRALYHAAVPPKRSKYEDRGLLGT